MLCIAKKSISLQLLSANTTSKLANCVNSIRANEIAQPVNNYIVGVNGCVDTGTVL